jgi:hypothetical protein
MPSLPFEAFVLHAPLLQSPKAIYLVRLLLASYSHRFLAASLKVLRMKHTVCLQSSWMMR